MTLFDESRGLARVQQMTETTGGQTHRAHCLSHFGHTHEDCQPSPTERRDSQFVDIAEFGRRVQYSHIVEF